MFGCKPGYMHQKHFDFLEMNGEAFRNGKDPVPYLCGEFPELSEAQAAAICQCWRDRYRKENPQPGRGNKGWG